MFLLLHQQPSLLLPPCHLPHSTKQLDDTHNIFYQRVYQPHSTILTTSSTKESTLEVGHSWLHCIPHNWFVPPHSAKLLDDTLTSHAEESTLEVASRIASSSLTVTPRHLHDLFISLNIVCSTTTTISSICAATASLEPQIPETPLCRCFFPRDPLLGWGPIELDIADY